MASWFVAHTKIRQEKVALNNLERQGYRCYLPTLHTEKLIGSAVKVVEEALFPRYLFIAADNGMEVKGWSPIRSTTGVSRLVTFGQQPARIEDDLVEVIKSRAESERDVKRRFQAGDSVCIVNGAFKGLEAIFSATDGDARAVVLLSLLSQQVKLALPAASVRLAN